MTHDDEYDPLYCPRCHQRVARDEANPDGWCYRCVADADRARRNEAQQRDEKTKPRCPQCGGTDVVLTMGSTPLRSMRRTGWILLDLLMVPFTIGTGLWGWAFAASRHNPDMPSDPGEPMWRCKACDRVFPMK